MSVLTDVSLRRAIESGMKYGVKTTGIINFLFCPNHILTFATLESGNPRGATSVCVRVDDNDGQRGARQILAFKAVEFQEIAKLQTFVDTQEMQ